MELSYWAFKVTIQRKEEFLTRCVMQQATIVIHNIIEIYISVILVFKERRVMAKGTTICGLKFKTKVKVTDLCPSDKCQSLHNYSNGIDIHSSQSLNCYLISWGQYRGDIIRTYVLGIIINFYYKGSKMFNNICQIYLDKI
jgi:hypothetical protein